MKMGQQMLARILVISILMLSLAGLSAAQDVPTLVVFRGGVEIDDAADPVILEIERIMGIDIQFKTAAWSEISQVRNLALGAGEDVDIYHHMDLNTQWVNDEVIIPLNDYITPEAHPYLTAITTSPMFESLKRDGDIYYIPMIAHGWDWVFSVRKDWMDELGLDMPTNEIEFRELLQAFKDRDPDGRTVGMQLEGGAQIRRGILPILTAFGVPTTFYDVDRTFTVDAEGNLQPVVIAENTRAAMQYLNSLYNEGLINTDFPSMNSMPMLLENYLQAGKAGVGWTQNPRNYVMAEDDVEWAFIPPFSATGYEHTRAVGVANNGWISVSATSDNPQLAVDLLEFINSREGRELLVAGVEGVHYTSFDDDGNFARNAEAWSADYQGQTYPLYFYFGQGLMHGYIPVEEYDTFEEALANLTVWEPSPEPTGLREVISESARWTGAPQMFQFVDIPELADIRVELNDAIVTGWTKVVTAAPGEFDNEWANFVAEWERVGGREWTAAYQTYYNEMMN